MAKKSERSLQFKRNYLKFFNEGWMPKEIIEHFGLSLGHGYRLIRELAEELGVSHHDLLSEPHKDPLILGRKSLSLVKTIDVSEFQKEFRSTISLMDKTNNAMEAVLKNWPEEENSLNKEEN